MHLNLFVFLGLTGKTYFSAAGDIEGKYKSFLSGKYQELPEEFSF